jgi:membrane protein
VASSAGGNRSGGTGTRRDDLSVHHHDDPAARPDPDDPVKPDSPDEITKPSWGYVLKKTVREFLDDECIDLAAALTYYAVLALFPALLAVVSVLGLVGQGGQTTDALITIVEDFAPANVVEIVRGVVQQLTQSQAAGFAFVTGLVVALWSASGYVAAFSRAMNRIYEIEEGRPFWKLRPFQIVITLGAVLLIAVVAVGLVVSGPLARSVGEAIGLGDAAVTAWQVAKWPVLVAIVVVIIAILYYATPNVQQPKFRWMSMGAFVALVTWVLASVAFGFYVANFGSYNKTYGTLAGVIVFLLWLWITNLALLFGAEVDSEVERGRELQAGLPAEETLQLPARDTTKIDKDRAKEQEEIAEARRLRPRVSRSRE